MKREPKHFGYLTWDQVIEYAGIYADFFREHQREPTDIERHIIIVKAKALAAADQWSTA